ncbi:MAG: hypothetical protein Aurels2KO_20850 [Aureliella sp.]
MIRHKIFNGTLFFLPPEDRENFANLIKNPYSKHEDEHKVIFVHVPKAAGTAVARALLGAPNGTGHPKLYMYRLRDKRKFDEYFKFSFVRNPWSRLVSAFFFLKQFSEPSNHKQFFEKSVGVNTSFEEFVDQLAESTFRKKITKWEHFTLQADYLLDKGKVGVDFLGRFESLDDDYAQLSEKLNFEVQPLKPFNSSIHDDFRQYYDSRRRDIVGDVYRKDIELFGYSFD